MTRTIFVLLLNICSLSRNLLFSIIKIRNIIVIVVIFFDSQLEIYNVIRLLTIVSNDEFYELLIFEFSH